MTIIVACNAADEFYRESRALGILDPNNSLLTTSGRRVYMQDHGALSFPAPAITEALAGDRVTIVSAVPPVQIGTTEWVRTSDRIERDAAMIRAAAIARGGKAYQVPAAGYVALIDCPRPWLGEWSVRAGDVLARMPYAEGHTWAHRLASSARDPGAAANARAIALAPILGVAFELLTSCDPEDQIEDLSRAGLPSFARHLPAERCSSAVRNMLAIHRRHSRLATAIERAGADLPAVADLWGTLHQRLDSLPLSRERGGHIDWFLLNGAAFVREVARHQWATLMDGLCMIESPDPRMTIAGLRRRSERLHRSNSQNGIAHFRAGGFRGFRLDVAGIDRMALDESRLPMRVRPRVRLINVRGTIERWGDGARRFGEDGSLIIDLLRTSDDYIEEGSRMRHCIANGPQYYERWRQGIAANFCAEGFGARATFEIDGEGRIVQIQGRYNQHPGRAIIETVEEAREEIVGLMVFHEADDRARDDCDPPRIVRGDRGRMMIERGELPIEGTLTQGMARRLAQFVGRAMTSEMVARVEAEIREEHSRPRSRYIF